MSTGKVIAGALVGLAAGAILGVLFAPDKGTETRRKISKKGKDTADDLKSKYNDAVDAVSSKIETWKSKGEQTAAETAEFLDKAKTNLETNL